MPFFDFLKKTPKGPRIKVRVWVDQSAKEKACIKMAQSETSLVFIAWSKVTSQHFHEVFKRQNLPNEVITASDIIPSRMTGRNFVLLERHYDQDKEKKFLESLNSNDVLVHVSLSDPLLSAFNADGIRKVMDRMGHKEDEYIEHEMVNKSIERAMEKIKNSDLKQNSSGELMEWIEGIN